MTKEEIEKNNILIAKFLGCTLSKEPTLNHVYVWSGDFEPLNGKLNFDYVLKFHSSWDWLIPVIEKLQNITEEPEKLDYLKETLWWGTIFDVYEEVIDCINEYNKKE